LHTEAVLQRESTTVYFAISIVQIARFGAATIETRFAEAPSLTRFEVRRCFGMPNA